MGSDALSVGDHSFTAQNGITYHYVISGAGPLVVLPTVGWGPSYQVYKKLLGKLEEDFTVLYFEVRGIGGSSRPSAKEMGTKDMASDLKYLREHLGLDKLTLIGHSHAGDICLTYAKEFPETVEKLVLIDAPIQGPSSDQFKKYIQARKDDPVYGAALQAALYLKEAVPDSEDELTKKLLDVTPFYFSDPTKARQVGEAMKDAKVYVFNRVNQRICDQEAKYSAEEGVGKVKARTLILTGEEDPWCSMESSQKLAQSIKNAQLKGLANSGHFSFLESPNEFYSTLTPFLKA
ncbi:Alpha/Beta hydrolase protein [Xylogone sp. PMI_703]|nr:Alpha/Beta hydrolase protein [Xylogone sp. PMI_703]